MIHKNTYTRVIVLSLFALSPLSLYAESASSPVNTLVSLPPLQVNSGKAAGAHIKPTNHPTTTSASTTLMGDGGREGRVMASDTRPLSATLKGDIEGRETGSTTSGTRRGMPHDGMGSSSLQNDLRRSRTGEHRGDIFQQATEVLIKRLHAALDRFSTLANRIDSRISKMKSSGTDTADISTKMVIVRTKISIAQQQVKDADAKIAEVASSLNNATSSLPSNEEKKPAKDSLNAARQSIIEVQKSLADIMPLILSERSPKVNEQSSSTPGTTTVKMRGAHDLHQETPGTTTSSTEASH